MANLTQTGILQFPNMSNVEQQINKQNDDNMIGIGIHSTVKALKYNQSDEYLAIKMIPLVLDNQDQYQHLLRVENEIRFQRQLNHPNIVRCYDYYKDNKMIYVLMELAQRGNLYQYMRMNQIKIFTEEEFFPLFFQICLGLDYIHQDNLIHGNLTTDNILLDKVMNVKICDFGKMRQKNQSLILEESDEINDYMAPELILNQKSNEKVDIWSLGVIMFEVLHDKFPFKKDKINETIENICYNSPEISKQLSPKLRHLIQQMLTKNPAHRIDLQSIFTHPWFCDQAQQFNMNFLHHKEFEKNFASLKHVIPVEQNDDKSQINRLENENDQIQKAQDTKNQKQDEQIKLQAQNIKNIHQEKKLKLEKDFSPVGKQKLDSSFNDYDLVANSQNINEVTIKWVQSDIKKAENSSFITETDSLKKQFQPKTGSFGGFKKQKQIYFGSNQKLIDRPPVFDLEKSVFHMDDLSGIHFSDQKKKLDILNMHVSNSVSFNNKKINENSESIDQSNIQVQLNVSQDQSINNQQKTTSQYLKSPKNLTVKFENKTNLENEKIDQGSPPLKKDIAEFRQNEKITFDNQNHQKSVQNTNDKQNRSKSVKNAIFADSKESSDIKYYFSIANQEKNIKKIQETSDIIQQKKQEFQQKSLKKIQESKKNFDSFKNFDIDNQQQQQSINQQQQSILHSDKQQKQQQQSIIDSNQSQQQQSIIQSNQQQQQSIIDSNQQQQQQSIIDSNKQQQKLKQKYDQQRLQQQQELKQKYEQQQLQQQKLYLQQYLEKQSQKLIIIDNDKLQTIKYNDQNQQSQQQEQQQQILNDNNRNIQQLLINDVDKKQQSDQKNDEALNANNLKKADSDEVIEQDEQKKQEKFDKQKVINQNNHNSTYFQESPNNLGVSQGDNSAQTYLDYSDSQVNPEMRKNDDFSSINGRYTERSNMTPLHFTPVGEKNWDDSIEKRTKDQILSEKKVTVKVKEIPVQQIEYKKIILNQEQKEQKQTSFVDDMQKYALNFLSSFNSRYKEQKQINSVEQQKERQRGKSVQASVKEKNPQFRIEIDQYKFERNLFKKNIDKDVNKNVLNGIYSKYTDENL